MRSVNVNGGDAMALWLGANGKPERDRVFLVTPKRRSRIWGGAWNVFGCQWIGRPSFSSESGENEFIDFWFFLLARRVRRALDVWKVSSFLCFNVVLFIICMLVCFFRSFVYRHLIYEWTEVAGFMNEALALTHASSIDVWMNQDMALSCFFLLFFLVNWKVFLAAYVCAKIIVELISGRVLNVLTQKKRPKSDGSLKFDR